jgi:gas vesicle protein
MNSHKVFWGALGLLAGGAIAGVLFAPAKGKNTRKRIVNSTVDYADELKGKVDDLMEDINDTVDIVKHEAEHLARKLKR